MSSVVLISDLLYQSAGIVFLDGGRVSEELVMFSLAFHLFGVGTVIFASVLLCHSSCHFQLLRANLWGVLCTETVEATMPMAVKSYHDATISR